MAVKHQQTHPRLDVEGCFACRVSSVNFGAEVMLTRTPDVAACAARERRWDKDIPAYKAMRKDHVQPRGVDGAHEVMMRAETREQVEGIPKLADQAGDILEPLRKSEMSS